MIPPDESLIQLAVVTEVNGAGIMLSGCGLLATVVYLPINLIIYMKYKDILVHFSRPWRVAEVCARQQGALVVRALAA